MSVGKQPLNWRLERHHVFDTGDEMNNRLLAFLILRNVASRNRKEHRRSWGEIKRYIVSERSSRGKGYDETHSPLLDVVVPDSCASYVSILTLQIGPQTTVLDDGGNILHMCNVINVWQL